MSQDWETGYNDGQNDYLAGKASHSSVAGAYYHNAYSQGYIDARDGLYQLC
jgi:hypothetical protein